MKNNTSRRIKAWPFTAPLLAACTALSFTTQAQTKTRELHWQNLPESMQKTIVATPVNVGQFTIFQITDINKFLYKVEIKGSVFELETPVPNELEALFRLRPVDLQKTVSNKKAEEAVGEISKAIPPMEVAKDKTDEKVTSLTEQVQDLENKVTAAQSRVALSNTKANQDSLKKVSEQLETAETKLADKESLAETLEEVIEKCKAYLELSKVVAEDVFKLKNARSELIAIAQMDGPFTIIRGKAGSVDMPTAVVKDNYIALKELYEELEALYGRAAMLSEETNEDVRIVKAIKTSLERIEKADELIDQEALIGLYTDVDFLHQELQNKNNFNVISPPVQMDADLVQYTVNITPSATRSLGVPHRNPMEFTFEVPTKGGLKVDFSVGPVVSFGSQARDEKFFLEEAPGGATVTLRRRKNKNAITPSIAAMMHAYSRTGKYSGVGGMFGIGAGFQSQNSIDANLFAGVSYVWGKKQKLMLSGGVSYLRVQRLKEGQFVADTSYDAAKITLTDVTEPVFKPSPFLSVSYNLSNRVEIK